MSYKSLYRKYRPMRFEDVCGQQFIVKTLSNAIKNNKIGMLIFFAELEVLVRLLLQKYLLNLLIA